MCQPAPQWRTGWLRCSKVLLTGCHFFVSSLAVGVAHRSTHCTHSQKIARLHLAWTDRLDQDSIPSIMVTISVLQGSTQTNLVEVCIVNTWLKCYRANGDVQNVYRIHRKRTIWESQLTTSMILVNRLLAFSINWKNRPQSLYIFFSLKLKAPQGVLCIAQCTLIASKQ